MGLFDEIVPDYEEWSDKELEAEFKYQQGRRRNGSVVESLNAATHLSDIYEELRRRR